MTFNTHPNLYQIDSKGKLRFWRMETEDGKHRTVSGLVDGKAVTSGWVVCEPKNVGRSNATTPEEQALLEVKADYVLKLDKKYYYSTEEARIAGPGTKFLSPMLANKWEDFEPEKYDGVFYYSQPKLDGIRATISRDGMLSRAGKPITSCPHIVDALTEWFYMHPDVQALDGELYNHDLKHDFDRLSSLIKKQKPSPDDLVEVDKHIQFHCYDIIMPGLFEDRIAYRNEHLDRIYCIRHVETIRVASVKALDELHAQFIGEGYEGSMVRLNGPYESKRSKYLMKRKDFFDAEFPIEEFMEGKGDWAGAVKAVKFRMPDGRLTDQGEHPEAGCRGSKEFLTDLWSAYMAQNCQVPTHATVRYPNLTPRGFPRFGIVTQWHYGKREW